MDAEIIDKVPLDLIMPELTLDKQLRMTNKSNNEIYVITHHDSPNTMREIGRLREITFRMAGGGTGKSYDVDPVAIDPEETDDTLKTAILTVENTRIDYSLTIDKTVTGVSTDRTFYFNVYKWDTATNA